METRIQVAFRPYPGRKAGGEEGGEEHRGGRQLDEVVVQVPVQYLSITYAPANRRCPDTKPPGTTHPEERTLPSAVKNGGHLSGRLE